MAKTGFWLNGAKGKVAGTTIYQSNGETVMRVINRSVKNPRTTAQLIQRIITKTVAKQYSAMKEICDHSFEGVTAGANTMAKFRSVNNTLIRERIAAAQQAGNKFDEIFNFTPLKTNKLLPVAVQVSEGSLPRMAAVCDGDTAQLSMPNGANTYQSVIDTLGLERGDQLTFVTIETINESGNLAFKFARVILDPREADGTAAPLSTAFIGEHNTIVKPSFRNEGSFYNLVFETGDAAAKNKIKFSFHDGVYAAAVIASRKVNNDWLRSTEVMALSSDLEGYEVSLQEALDLAIQGTEIYTDSQRYLNNAGVGGPQEETPAP